MNEKRSSFVTHKNHILSTLLIVINVFFITACSQETIQETKQEFEIVSFYIDYKDVTNIYGGKLRSHKYVQFGYISDNNKVIFDEVSFESVNDFRITEDTPKIIVTENSINGKNYSFYLSKDMYNNLSFNQN